MLPLCQGTIAFWQQSPLQKMLENAETPISVAVEAGQIPGPEILCSEGRTPHSNLEL
jgi:hypothetical protein